jgi:methionyl-tRNA formyltransferase
LLFNIISDNIANLKVNNINLSKFKQKVLFYGTPSFAVESLDFLVKQGINIIGVVTAPDRKSGRGQQLQFSDVKKYALDNDIEVFQPTNLKSEVFQEVLKELDPDIQVVIAFRMLPEMVWNYPKLGTYNIHASLLPNYRGAAPINWALYNGEKETGVTAFKLKHKIDTGDIAGQRRISIEKNDNFQSLHDKLAVLGSETIYETLVKLFKGDLELISQPKIAMEREAPKINKEDLLIPEDKNANEVFNMIRAFSPYPGARIIFRKKIVKILGVKMVEFNEVKNQEKLFFENNTLFLSCNDSVLEVILAQFEGKRAMNAQEILNGRMV